MQIPIYVSDLVFTFLHMIFERFIKIHIKISNLKFPLWINSHAHWLRTPSRLTLSNRSRQNFNKYSLVLNGNLSINMQLHQLIFDEIACKSYISWLTKTQESNFIVQCSDKSNYLKKQLYDNTIPLCFDPRDCNFHSQHSLFQTWIILLDRIELRIVF